jgi:hypothetical protein
MAEEKDAGAANLLNRNLPVDIGVKKQFIVCRNLACRSSALRVKAFGDTQAVCGRCRMGAAGEHLRVTTALLPTFCHEKNA